MKPRVFTYSKRERDLLARLAELELRVSVLEQLPTPIVFAIGQAFPQPIRADMQMPSEMEH